jgi:tetratricopeptide (TPR) repeat protein
MMRSRFSRSLSGLAAFALAGLITLSAGLPAAAQTNRAAPQGDKAEDGKAKRSRPNNVDRSKDIEFLFGALKAAPDAAAARVVESRIQALWMVSGSDTTDLLMTRAKKALDLKDVDLSIQLLDAVIETKPDYVEGWNRRATLYFMKKDFGASLADLRQVLAREPRHFGALVGLGMILQEIDEDKMALTVLRRALELHPHLPRIGDMIKTLTEKVEGRPI